VSEEDNLRIVRGIYDAVARRDAAAAFAVYAHDIVWDPSQASWGSLRERPVYHGHEGVREAWRESLSVFGEVDVVLMDAIADGDKVLAVVRELNVGRSSGVPVEGVHYAVWTLAGGKVTRMQVFADRAAAVAASGREA
jgi:ketosteroid isomerase-like protein